MSVYNDSEPQKTTNRHWTAAEDERLLARRQTGESWDETCAAFSDRTEYAVRKRHSTLKGNREKEAVGAQGHKSVQVLGVTSHQDSKPGPGRPQRIRAPPKMFGQQLGTQELRASGSLSSDDSLAGDASPEASEICCGPPRSKRSRPNSQSELPGHSLTQDFNKALTDIVDSVLNPGICKLETEKEELQQEVTGLKKRRRTDTKALKVSQQNCQERENQVKKALDEKKEAEAALKRSQQDCQERENEVKKAVNEKVKDEIEKAVVEKNELQAALKESQQNCQERENEVKKALDEKKEAEAALKLSQQDCQERENEVKKAVDERVKDEIKKAVDEKSELQAALKEEQHRHAICRAESEKKAKLLQKFQNLADLSKN
ncbi:hypothetical protein MMC08_003694 [Hypocenomyce scalaris]|nr:hypothetical protein [Hypocenomyce scalaris]